MASDLETIIMNRRVYRRSRNSDSRCPFPVTQVDGPVGRVEGPQAVSAQRTSVSLRKWNGLCTTPARSQTGRGALRDATRKSLGKSTIAGVRKRRQDRVSGVACRAAVTRSRAKGRPALLRVSLS